MAVAALAVMAAATAYQMYQSKQQQVAAEHHASDQENALKNAQTSRDNNISQIDAIFGQGTSPTAQKNAGTLADTLNSYYQNQLDTGMRSATDQYATTSRTTRQNLARAGQLGGGVDAAAQGGSLADYLRSQQTAMTNATSARNGLASSLDQQRVSLDNQVAGGSLANPNLGQIASDRQSQLSAANMATPANAVGSALGGLGPLTSNAAIQTGMGNQGLAAFLGSSAPTNRGRITSN